MFRPGTRQFEGSFIGTSGQRLRDMANTQAAFARLGYDRYGENPRENAQRAQARTVQARVESMSRGVTGKLTVQFEPLEIEDGLQQIMGALGSTRYG